LALENEVTTSEPRAEEEDDEETTRTTTTNSEPGAFHECDSEEKDAPAPPRRRL
jgi:hypothetical protein